MMIILSIKLMAMIWVFQTLGSEIAYKLNRKWLFTCGKCLTFWVSLAITPFMVSGIDIIAVPAVASLLAYLVSTIKVTL